MNGGLGSDMRHEKLYGVHAVLSALRGQRRQVEKVVVEGRRRGSEVQRILDLATQRGIPVETVPGGHLHRLLGHRHHQGVVALVAPLGYCPFDQMMRRLKASPEPQTVVLLDGVTDVGNFAAFVRSAVAFGVDYILLPRHRSVPLTPTVARRSAGAIERLAVVQVGNAVRALDALKAAGFWVYGAEAQAPCAVGRMQWPERVVLVLGSEDRGLRRLVRDRCDGMVRIPMRPGADSLNVAVAGAIILASIWARHAAVDSACERPDVAAPPETGSGDKTAS